MSLRVAVEWLLFASVLVPLFACQGDDSSPQHSLRPEAIVAHANRSMVGHSQPTTYDEAVARLNRSLANRLARAERRPGSWLAADAAARAALDRASLTGDLADYRSAERLVDIAFERAPDGAGPWLTRAAVNMALHRFDSVEADLVAAERVRLVDEPTRMAILGLRADAAFEAGAHDRALELAEEALMNRRGADGLIRLASYHRRLDDYEEAEAYLHEALETLPRSATVLRAWLHLQRGLIDLQTGQLTEALIHCQQAEATLSGWWLVRLQRAEVDTRLEVARSERAL